VVALARVKKTVDFALTLPIVSLDPLVCERQQDGLGSNPEPELSYLFWGVGNDSRSREPLPDSYSDSREAAASCNR
jgi:hypothetical protein